MAVGESQTGDVVVRETDRVPPGATVRHFDELGHREQELFLRCYRGEAVADPGGLASVDVVVFTDYYQVAVD